jgi:hypothetical protein
MLHNRLFKMFGIAIALVLAVMMVLTVQAGLATKAVADRSYDQIEQLRAARPAVPADRSYDSLEALRANRSASAVTVDASDDKLAELRARRLAAAVAADASDDKLNELRARRAWASAANSYDPLRENDAVARWLILAQNSGQH